MAMAYSSVPMPAVSAWRLAWTSPKASECSASPEPVRAGRPSSADTGRCRTSAARSRSCASPASAALKGLKISLISPGEAGPGLSALMTCHALLVRLRRARTESRSNSRATSSRLTQYPIDLSTQSWLQAHPARARSAEPKGRSVREPAVPVPSPSGPTGYAGGCLGGACLPATCGARRRRAAGHDDCSLGLPGMAPSAAVEIDTQQIDAQQEDQSSPAGRLQPGARPCSWRGTSRHARTGAPSYRRHIRYHHPGRRTQP